MSLEKIFSRLLPLSLALTQLSAEHSAKELPYEQFTALFLTSGQGEERPVVRHVGKEVDEERVFSQIQGSSEDYKKLTLIFPQLPTNPLPTSISDGLSQKDLSTVLRKWHYEVKQAHKNYSHDESLALLEERIISFLADKGYDNLNVAVEPNGFQSKDPKNLNVVVWSKVVEKAYRFKVKGFKFYEGYDQEPVQISGYIDPKVNLILSNEGYVPPRAQLPVEAVQLTQLNGEKMFYGSALAIVAEQLQEAFRKEGWVGVSVSFDPRQISPEGKDLRDETDEYLNVFLSVNIPVSDRFYPVDEVTVTFPGMLPEPLLASDLAGAKISLIETQDGFIAPIGKWPTESLSELLRSGSDIMLEEGAVRKIKGDLANYLAAQGYSDVLVDVDPECIDASGNDVRYDSRSLNFLIQFKSLIQEKALNEVAREKELDPKAYAYYLQEEAQEVTSEAPYGFEKIQNRGAGKSEFARNAQEKMEEKTLSYAIDEFRFIDRQSGDTVFIEDYIHPQVSLFKTGAGYSARQQNGVKEAFVLNGKKGTKQLFDLEALSSILSQLEQSFEKDGWTGIKLRLDPMQITEQGKDARPRSVRYLNIYLDTEIALGDSGYEAGRLTLSYPAAKWGPVPLEGIEELTLKLLETDEGYIAPVGKWETVSLDEVMKKGEPFVLRETAISKIEEEVAQYLANKGLGKVCVRIDPKQIDEDGKDLRLKKETLNFVISSAADGLQPTVHREAQHSLPVTGQRPMPAPLAPESTPAIPLLQMPQSRSSSYR